MPKKPHTHRAGGEAVTFTNAAIAGYDPELVGDWELLYADGAAVTLGDIVVSRSQSSYVVTGGRAPHSINSSGRVYVVSNDLEAESTSFFPGVFDLKWVKKG